MKLYVATKNKNKLREIKEILDGSGFEVESAFENIDMDVAETGDTFLANASLKAVALSKELDGYVIADDSGLSVDALNGRPGVYSARFAGEDATDEKNNDKLLAVMEPIPDGSRDCSFNCVIALAYRGLVEKTFSGICMGTLGREPKGENGFGYDPLFIVEDGRTMAELSQDEKNSISHRSMAIRELRDYLFSISK